MHGQAFCRFPLCVALRRGGWKLLVDKLGAGGREVLLTIKKGLKVSKHNALSRNTAARRAGHAKETKRVEHGGAALTPQRILNSPNLGGPVFCVPGNRPFFSLREMYLTTSRYRS